MIDLTVDSGFCKNLCSLLEGCGWKEWICSKWCLGNTEHYLLALCRSLTFCNELFIHIVVIQNIHRISRKYIRIIVLFYSYLLKHLTNDNLDMLIVDLNTLKSVNSLYFTKHIILNGTNTFYLKDIMWIYTTFCKLVTCLKHITVWYLDSWTVWYKVRLWLTCFIICNNDFTLLLGILKLYNTAELCDDCKTLRLSCLEKLLDSRKTLCDISTGNTSGMESTHSKLCSRLTDRLCSYNTYCLTYLYSLTCSHVCTIALSTDTCMWFTWKYSSYLYAVSSKLLKHLHYCSGSLWSTHMICLNYHFPCIRICYSFCNISSCDSLLETLNNFLTVWESFDFHKRNLFAFTAVCFTNY